MQKGINKITTCLIVLLMMLASPASAVSVKFVFADEASKAAVQFLQIGSTTYRDDNGKAFSDLLTCSEGDYIDLRLNTTEYSVSQFDVNGLARQYMNLYAAVEADMEIAITAAIMGQIKFSVSVDNPDAVRVYKYAYEKDANLLGLKSGSNSFTFKSDMNRLLVIPEEKKTVSVTHNGRTVASYSTVAVTVTGIAEGSEVNVTTAKGTFAEVTVDDANKVVMEAVYGESADTVALYTGSNTNILAGRNYRLKSKEDYYRINKVELNNQPLQPTDGIYEFTLAEGDLLDISANYSDTSYKLDVRCTQGHESFVKSVTYGDGIEVADWTQALDVPAGYRVTVATDTEATQTPALKVNGVLQQYEAAYTLFMREDTSLEFDFTTASILQSVAAGKEEVRYNLSGQRINKADVKGTVIVNGKKIIAE